jgi:hypothetical protein
MMIHFKVEILGFVGFNMLWMLLRYLKKMWLGNLGFFSFLGFGVSISVLF